MYIMGYTLYMELTLWMQWYELILEDFGFKKDDDERSAETLNNILDDIGALVPQDIYINDKVIVFGAGPSLKPNLAVLKRVDLEEYTLIAADGATTALLEEGIVPNIIVTDLDGRMNDILDANHHGTLMVVHAHGNNQDMIEKYTPQLVNVLGTTQSKPLASVYNFGGFTDGDRCVFLAMALGARQIILSGMDFGKIVTHYSRPDQEDGPADQIKEKKLKWAKKLVQWAALHSEVKFLNISEGEPVQGVDNINPDLLNHNKS